jgi:hypothetical protein
MLFIPLMRRTVDRDLTSWRFFERFNFYRLLAERSVTLHCNLSCAIRGTAEMTNSGFDALLLSRRYNF